MFICVYILCLHVSMWFVYVYGCVLHTYISICVHMCICQVHVHVFYAYTCPHYVNVCYMCGYM